MTIKDLIDQKLTQEQIEQQIIRQGHLVMEVLSLPGWQVILSTLAVVKGNIERDRANNLRNATNGDRALYFSGKVDGFMQAIEEIHNIVTMADQVKTNRAAAQAEETDA